MSVNEGSRVTPRVRHASSIAVRVRRSLHCSWGKRDYEVAMHTACYSTVYCAGSIVGVACTGTGPCSGHEASVLELFNHEK